MNAVIDIDTGKALEYCHLVNTPNTKTSGEQAIQMS
jgi:hypothetical protein